MKITAWIQASDYSTKDLGEVSAQEAAGAVLSFPWADVLHEFAERSLGKDDTCPPGIGLNSDDGDIFHVYALAMDEWLLYLSQSRPGKILGLFRKPSKVMHTELKSLAKVVELLRLFGAGEKDKLATEAAKHPSRESHLPTLG